MIIRMILAMCFSILHCCAQNLPSGLCHSQSKTAEDPQLPCGKSALDRTTICRCLSRTTTEKVTFPRHVLYMHVHSGSWCTCILERIGFITFVQHSKTDNESATCIRTKALRYTPTPLSIRLAGSTV